MKLAKGNAISQRRESAIEQGATPIVGVTVDFELLGDGASIMMVAATGTAVVASSEDTLADSIQNSLR